MRFPAFVTAFALTLDVVVAAGGFSWFETKPKSEFPLFDKCYNGCMFGKGGDNVNAANYCLTKCNHLKVKPDKKLSGTKKNGKCKTCKDFHRPLKR